MNSESSPDAPGTPPSIPGDAIAKLFNDHKATRTDVEQIRSEAAERFTELRKAGSVGADEVATLAVLAVLAVLAEVSDAAAAELGELDTAEAEMQSQLDALDDRMATDPAPAGGELEMPTPSRPRPTPRQPSRSRPLPQSPRRPQPPTTRKTRRRSASRRRLPPRSSLPRVCACRSCSRAHRSPTPNPHRSPGCRWSLPPTCVAS